MARVTPTEVKVVIPTTLTDPVIQVWIDSANVIVDSAAACINGDEALLTKVELFLSSHFVALVDPDADSSKSSIKQEKTQDITTTYNTAELKNNINDTVYGRAANSLSKGCLITVNQEPATVEFF